MNAGKKYRTSSVRNLTGKSNSSNVNNFLPFLSENTTPAPPDIILHSRASKVITYAQLTLRVYALILVSITYFPQFTKKMGSMSREKFVKIGNFAKNLYL
jgi:hypothetical protein